MKITGNYFNTYKNYSTNNSAKNQSYTQSFTNRQITPLTDIDYAYARKSFKEQLKELESNFPDAKKFEAKSFNFSKLNGLQKGISIFDGLTMQEIKLALNNMNILVNRGCPNNCTHCGFMATPYSKSTLDRMSWEDLNTLISGIKELEKRMDNKVKLLDLKGLFLDSDCMEIELKDHQGETYDYADCIYLLSRIKQPILFDTSGWNPKSQKHQQRAENIVSILSSNPNLDIQQINISINPYHSLCEKYKNLKADFHFSQAKRMRQLYVERMANVLFTFTPLLNSPYKINVTGRTLPKGQQGAQSDDRELTKLNNDILKRLEELYIEDFYGEQKFAQNEMDAGDLVYLWVQNFQRNDIPIQPMGRAEELFSNNYDTKEKRAKALSQKINRRTLGDVQSLVNPNGSVVLSEQDISFDPQIQFNFQNKNKEVKPFAHNLN